MTHPDTTKSCPYSPHLGPVGCLPAPNIFPLAKETFAKGKMFWNNQIHKKQLKYFSKEPEIVSAKKKLETKLKTKDFC